VTVVIVSGAVLNVQLTLMSSFRCVIVFTVHGMLAVNYSLKSTAILLVCVMLICTYRE